MREMGDLSDADLLGFASGLAAAALAFYVLWPRPLVILRVTHALSPTRVPCGGAEGAAFKGR